MWNFIKGVNPPIKKRKTEDKILYYSEYESSINCPLTEKVWENPIYGTFNLYLPYAFFSAYVLFI
jgi:hypothetical protein